MKKLISTVALLAATMCTFAQHDVYVWKDGTYTAIEQADSVTYRNPANSVAKKKYYLPGGVEFNMVSVKGGTYLMGAQKDDATKPNYDPDAKPEEGPVHSVTVSDFALGETEVTEAMYSSITGSYKSSIVPRCIFRDEYALVFIEKLNTYMHTTNQIPADKNFCLPTEAEWEYAARGGQYSHGYCYAGSWVLDDVAWYKDNSGSKTKEVATMAPNELGLYGMSGNVSELCYDIYNAKYYGESDGLTDPTGPTGPSSSSNRVVRGGNHSSSANHCRVTYRSQLGSVSTVDTYYGFRLCLK